MQTFLLYLKIIFSQIEIIIKFDYQKYLIKSIFS